MYKNVYHGVNVRHVESYASEEVADSIHDKHRIPGI